MKLTKKNTVALGSAAVMALSMTAFAFAANPVSGLIGAPISKNAANVEVVEKATFNGDAADKNVLFTDEQAEGTSVTTSAGAQAAEKAFINGDDADRNALFTDEQTEGTLVTASAN